MSELNPCPMCGSPVEIDSGGCSEAYGFAWQTMEIRCTDSKGLHCGMVLSLSADMYYVKGSWSKFIEFWNKQVSK
jgi:hypothetical protein